VPEQGSEHTYNTMIKVASYAGNIDRALAVLEDMAEAGAAPTPAIWGSLLVACGKVCPFPYLLTGELPSASYQRASCAASHCDLPGVSSLQPADFPDCLLAY